MTWVREDKEFKNDNFRKDRFDLLPGVVNKTMKLKQLAKQQNATEENEGQITEHSQRNEQIVMPENQIQTLKTKDIFVSHRENQNTGESAQIQNKQ